MEKKLKEKRLELIEDLSLIILYGSRENLLSWLNKNNAPEEIIKLASKSVGFSNVVIEKKKKIEYYWHFIWISSDRNNKIEELGTLAHETSHYVDKIIDFFTKAREGEKIPTEIKSRIFQTIVKEGAKLILEEKNV